MVAKKPASARLNEDEDERTEAERAEAEQAEGAAEGTAKAGEQPSTGGSRMLESRGMAGAQGPVVRSSTTPDTPPRAAGSGFVRGRAMDSSVTRNPDKADPRQIDPQFAAAGKTDVYLPNQTLVAAEGADPGAPPVNRPYGSEPLGLNPETGEVIMTPPKEPSDPEGQAALDGAPTPTAPQPQERLQTAA